MHGTPGFPYQKLTFSECDLRAIADALWIAQEEYDKHATEVGKLEGHGRIAETFKRQQHRAAELHDRIIAEIG